MVNPGPTKYITKLFVAFKNGLLLFHLESYRTLTMLPLRVISKV